MRKETKMAVIAKWAAGQRCFSADAQKCADEIMEIGKDVSPQEVLEKARDEDTELHKCFTWDDEVAAEKYRVMQARRVLQFLVIKEEVEPEDRPEVRFFYKTDNQTGYKPTEFIVKNDDEHKLLLQRAWSELRAFKAKYSMLEELSEIFELIG